MLLPEEADVLVPSPLIFWEDGNERELGRSEDTEAMSMTVIELNSAASFGWDSVSGPEVDRFLADRDGLQLVPSWAEKRRCLRTARSFSARSTGFE